MSFSTDKTCALEKLKAFDCQISEYISNILTGYDKVFAAYTALHQYFDCYPNFIYSFLDCFDEPSILAEGIYYNQTSASLTDAKLIVRGTATEVTIHSPDRTAEFIVAGDAVVNNVTVKGGGYVGVLSAQAGATIKVIDTQEESVIETLRIVGCNGIGATVNAATFEAQINKIDITGNGYFGGYNCINPTDVCGDDVTAPLFSNISNHSLVLKWTDAAGSIRTIVYYRTSNAPEWLMPNNGREVTGNYIESGPGYVFRGLEESTFYDFKVVNVCANGVLSAGTVATQQTGGDISCGGGGGSIVIGGQIEFYATDGQTTYIDAALINATSVAVYIEGARKYVGAGAEDIEFDDTTGTITFNSPLIGPPTSIPGQRVQIDVFR